MAVAMTMTSAAALAENAATRPSRPSDPPVYRPLPVQAAGVESPVMSLCGDWRFSADPGKAFYTNPAAPAPGVANIEVPGEWIMQGFTVPADRAAGYRRSFTLPGDWKGARVILRADAIFSDCRLWINGKQAGGHLGGFTPFERDITDLVRPGENYIAISVRNESIANLLSSGSKYAVHPLGGITRKIRLFAAPATHVAMLNVSTDLDASYRDAIVKFAASVRNDSAAESRVTCTVIFWGRGCSAGLCARTRTSRWHPAGKRSS